MKFKFVRSFFWKKHNEKIAFLFFCNKENQGLGIFIPRD